MASATANQSGFHAQQDASGELLVLYKQDTEFTYTFENFFHPFVAELIGKLNLESLAGMLDPDFHQSLSTKFFDTFYTLLTSEVVKIERFRRSTSRAGLIRTTTGSCCFISHSPSPFI